MNDWVATLADELGDDSAAAAFSARVPEAYRLVTSPRQAAVDAAMVAGLGRSPRYCVVADGGDHPGGAGATDGAAIAFRLRRYSTAVVPLSTLLPVLESFGLVVVEALPTVIAAGADAPAVHIDDFGVRTAMEIGGRPDLVAGGAADRLVEAIEAVAGGRGEIDGLNRLVLAAGLDWVQVRLLRAYRRYRHQAGTTWSDAQLDEPLVRYPAVASALVSYAEARFDPDGPPDAGHDRRVEVLRALNDVRLLEDDQVLRAYLALVDATVRTSSYRRSADGSVPATVTLKFDSRAVPGLPAPTPSVEAWVHGAQVEGVHLRFGRIARGGLRWSDRPGDFRTEVLDLAAAQVKKNAIIVPTGAKGGFVVRSGDTDPDAVREAYETFVASLLDVTDNVVDGRIVPPERVAARDGDDPYLVVAADRGTATFSDLANALSTERDFWLGDAFASGGSNGYDHKAMGITARGAWVAVQQHFHQLGIDVQTETITVAGVGDMSGDVFGNGMLLSGAIALVAAFDHRHVFLDPTPDPAATFAERQRLFRLQRSSWDDFDRSVISEGGGVWPRDAKSVPLSPAARRALGVNAEELSPPELISAILRAPVDLLWFGGIGTYVRAPGEPDNEVGDHANDAVRITADQVRARVVAEGGNLGVTQRGRVRYSRRGGRINTDFIDNAAGVATSDREVNLKILVDLAIRQGRLPADERNAVLAAAEDFVADEVLRQVGNSMSALTRAVPRSAAELDAYVALIDHLERTGLLDRVVESLPSPEEVARRRSAGAGLIRPELAVVMAFAKSDLTAAVESSRVPDDPGALDAVRPYFPPALVERIGELIPEHRLYRQLAATSIAGELVDQLGPVWAHEMAGELGVDLGAVAAAFWAARQVLGAGQLWNDIVSVGPGVSADAAAALHATVADAVAALTRRYVLAAGGAQPTPSVLIGLDRPAVLALVGRAEGSAAPGQDHRTTDLIAGLVEAGAPGPLATAAALAAAAVDVADARVAATATGRTAPDALAALAELDRRAALERLAGAVSSLPVAGRWSTWQVRGLLDDLAGWRVRTATEALAVDGDPVAAVGRWLDDRRVALQRTTSLLEQLEAPVPADGGERSPAERLALAAAVIRRLPS